MVGEVGAAYIYGPSMYTAELHSYSSAVAM